MTRKHLILVLIALSAIFVWHQWRRLPDPGAPSCPLCRSHRLQVVEAGLGSSRYDIYYCESCGHTWSPANLTEPDQGDQGTAPSCSPARKREPE